jgi:UDP:flavonoid glycosyltransferase YjiC (YdhE family)
MTGHILPSSAILSALRGAGHDVVVAAYGKDIAKYRVLGLPIVDVGDATGLADAHRLMPTELSSGRPVDNTAERIFGHHAAVTAYLGRRTVDPLLSIVGAWKPDLLIHDPFQGAIPLVAALTGRPAVAHEFGLIGGVEVARVVRDSYAEDYGRYAAPHGGTVSIEVAPSSMRKPDPGSWHIRYVSQHGPAVITADLLAESREDRVLISFGTLVGKSERDERIAAMLPVLARSSSTYLVPAGEDLRLPLPANVHTLPWLPVTTVLPQCRAIIHHGGGGSMMAAMTTGTPQLIIPHQTDQFYNADAVVAAGVGLQADTSEAVEDVDLERLVNDDRLRSRATELQAENDARPSPASLVADLEALAREWPDS